MCLRSLTLALDFAYVPTSDLGPPEKRRDFRQDRRVRGSDSKSSEFRQITILQFLSL